jgi:hypothetical protein
MNRKKQTILLSLIICLGIILRLPYLIKYHFAINMDEAVVGIMAQDILHGEFPLFYYGQIYLGPLESFFTALFFLIFPHNTLTLRISILALTFLSLIIFWRGLCLMTKDRNGLYAFGWLILSPTILSVYSVLPRGHIGGIFSGSLVFYFAARIINAKKINWLDFLLFGSAIGFGLWMHPETIIYVFASGVIILLNNPRTILAVPFSILGCLTGGFPFWVKTIKMQFGTFNFGQNPLGTQSFLPLLKDFWQSVINMNGFLGYDSLTPFLSVVAWGGIILILLFSMACIIKWKDDELFSQKLVLIFSWLVIALTLLAYSFINASRFGFVSYRYYIPILIGLAFIFDLVFAEIGKGYPKLSLLMFLTLVILSLWANFQEFKNQTYLRYEVHFEEPYFQWRELPSFLEEKGIDRAYMDFFEEGPLNFVTREKIIGTNFYNTRYLRYSLMVDGTPNPAFVFRDKSEAKLFKRGLDSLESGRYSITQTPNYEIFYNIKAPGEIYTPINRKGIKIYANPNNNLASSLLDGNMATTWSTEGSQKGDESIFLDLGRVTDLARVDLISKWHDLPPVHIVIETSLDNRRWLEAADVPTSSTLYWTGEHPAYKVLEGFNQYIFPKRTTRYVRIKQMGANPNPWVLAEIYLYASDGGENPSSRIDWERLIAFLKEKGIKKVISDLFFSANVISRSADKITANVRYNESYPDDPRGKWDYSTEEMTAVAVQQKDLEEVLLYLNDQRWHYNMQTFGEYSLIFQLKSPLSPMNRLVPGEWEIKASHNQNGIRFMTNQIRGMVWQSMAPRRPGMFIICDLKNEKEVSAIILDPGKNLQDVANALKIYHSEDGTTWEEVNNALRFHTQIRWTGSHLIGSGTSSAYIFSPVKTRYLKIVCMDNNNVFYWSIGDLSILGPKRHG